MLSDMKTIKTPSIQRLQARIADLKTALSHLGDLHPGSLSKQYNVCGKPGCRCKDRRRPRPHGPYYQLNYVFRAKKTSVFIPASQVRSLRAELANYKKLRHCSEQWIALSLQIAQLRRKANRLKKSAPKS
jgi:hypothetical protein